MSIFLQQTICDKWLLSWWILLSWIYTTQCFMVFVIFHSFHFFAKQLNRTWTIKFKTHKVIKLSHTFIGRFTLVHELTNDCKWCILPIVCANIANDCSQTVKITFQNMLQRSIPCWNLWSICFLFLGFFFLVVVFDIFF